MAQPGAPTMAGHDDSGSRGMRIPTGWLPAVRVFSALLVAFALAVFLASVPPYLAQLRAICTDLPANCPSGTLTMGQIQTLNRLGIPAGAYVATTLALGILSTLIWLTVGLVLLWRRSDDGVAVLFALQLVTQGASGNTTGALEQAWSFWYMPARILDVFNLSLLALVFAIFPSGRFVPRWLRWLVALWIIYNVVSLVLVPASFDRWIGPLNGFLFLFVLGMLGVAQIYRYARVSTPTQRQQTKWIVLALGAIVTVELIANLPLLFVPELNNPDSLYFLGPFIVLPVVLLLGPLASAIAILRYRLWDIDILINRALVYGSLSALLTLVYLALVLGLQALTAQVTGQSGDNPLVIVLSTLLIAALFQLLRTRIQTFIDRRFYRRKYDAAKTLAAFSATLRGQTELGQLRTRLVGVVDETMQPAHISLWLREAEPRTRAPGTERANSPS